MHKLIVLAAIAFFAFIMWIIFLADTGGQNVILELVKATPYGDKVGHFFLFGLLTFVLNLALRLATFQIFKFPIYLGTGIVIVFVVVEELSQVFFPARTLDMADLVADSLGVFAFSCANYLIGITQLTKNSSKNV